jgi:hypothetical protein
MTKRRFALSAGTGLVLGAGAAASTGHWWLVGVGLVLGAGAERVAARRGR